MFLRNFKILGSGAFKGVKGWGLEGEGHEKESLIPISICHWQIVRRF